MSGDDQLRQELMAAEDNGKVIAAIERYLTRKKQAERERRERAMIAVDVGYTVQRVLRAGRVAIAADPMDDDTCCYLYIPQGFFKVDAYRGTMKCCQIEDVPDDGWSHVDGCGCYLCAGKKLSAQSLPNSESSARLQAQDSQAAGNGETRQ